MEILLQHDLLLMANISHCLSMDIIATMNLLCQMKQESYHSQTVQDIFHHQGQQALLRLRTRERSRALLNTNNKRQRVLAVKGITGTVHLKKASRLERRKNTHGRHDATREIETSMVL